MLLVCLYNWLRWNTCNVTLNDVKNFAENISVWDMTLLRNVGYLFTKLHEVIANDSSPHVFIDCLMSAN